MVGEGRGLVHQVAGDEDGAALAGQPPHQLTDPDDAFRVQSVRRFVQHHHLRISEQRRGNTETLAHAERERLDPLPTDRAETGFLEHLLDPAACYAVARGERQQVVARGPRAVRRLRIEQSADPAQRVAERGVGLSADRGGTARGTVQAEDESHGGGLPGAVRTEKSRHPARPHAEREVVHGAGRSVVLRELVNVDAGHDPRLAAGHGPWPPRPSGPSPSHGGASGRSALARWQHAPPPQTVGSPRHLQPMASPAHPVRGRQRVAVHFPGKAMGSLLPRDSRGADSRDAPRRRSAGSAAPHTTGARPSGRRDLHYARGDMGGPLAHSGLAGGTAAVRDRGHLRNGLAAGHDGRPRQRLVRDPAER